MSPILSARGGMSANAYGWGAAVAAGVASFESIATFTGNGTTQTATFSSIPSTFQHLQIRASVTAASGFSPDVRFNSDSGANYSRIYIRVANATISTAGQTATNQLALFPNGTTGLNPSTLIMNIFDYKSTSKYKTVQWTEAYLSGGAPMLVFGQGLWLNTSAINSITFGASTYQSTNNIALYGMKGLA